MANSSAGHMGLGGGGDHTSEASSSGIHRRWPIVISGVYIRDFLLKWVEYKDKTVRG